MVDWEVVSKYQQLSEEFIEKHEDLVDWENVFRYQDISREFRERYQHKLQ
jgi:hypothetical protein